MRKLWRSQSQALRSGAWWDNEQQWTSSGTREDVSIYPSYMARFSCKDNQAVGQMPRRAVQTLSLEDFKT